MGITLDWRALGGILPERGGRRSGPAGLLRLPPGEFARGSCMYLHVPATQSKQKKVVAATLTYPHQPTDPHVAMWLKGLPQIFRILRFMSTPGGLNRFEYPYREDWTSRADYPVRLSLAMALPPGLRRKSSGASARPCSLPSL